MSCALIIQLFKEPDCLRDLSLTQWRQIILVLRHHHLLARYADRFLQLDLYESLPEYCQHHFNNARIIADNQYLQIHYEASELSNSINQDVDYLIFLKGAGYTLSGHPVGRNRICNDIDMLVDFNSIKKVEQRLFLQGWLGEINSDYDVQYYRKWCHEIPPLRHSKRGTVIDIHHNIVPPISGRAPDVSALLNQVNTTKDAYKILSPAAMTLHSAVHLFFNEDMNKGYRDLIDLNMLMSTAVDECYWITLMQLARDTDFEFELFLACRYTNSVLGTNIPAYVTEGLKKYSVFKLKFLDMVFMTVLTPVHPYSKPKFFPLAEFIILLRGHYLKMPLHILTYHLLAKSFMGLTTILFGKHFFEKDRNKP